MALLPARLTLRELLMELAGIEQDQGRELDRAGRGVDRAAVALADKDREQPAMVEVCVRQEHGVELARVERERDAVTDRLVRAALEHPAIDEHLRPFGNEQVLGTSDGGRATKEVDLHPRMVTAREGSRYRAPGGGALQARVRLPVGEPSAYADRRGRRRPVDSHATKPARRRPSGASIGRAHADRSGAPAPCRLPRDETCATTPDAPRIRSVEPAERESSPARRRDPTGRDHRWGFGRPGCAATQVSSTRGRQRSQWRLDWGTTTVPVGASTR